MMPQVGGDIPLLGYTNPVLSNLISTSVSILNVKEDGVCMNKLHGQSGDVFARFRGL
jgi:hypothetical protein